MYNIGNPILEIECFKFKEFLFNKNWLVKEEIANRQVIRYSTETKKLDVQPKAGDIKMLMSHLEKSKILDRDCCVFKLGGANAEYLTKKPNSVWEIRYEKKHCYFNSKAIGWFLYRLRQEELYDLKWSLNFIEDLSYLFLTYKEELYFCIRENYI